MDRRFHVDRRIRGLTIGRGVDVSSGAQIYTHSTAQRCVSGREYNIIDRRPVSIGNSVFIGANATILMGVTIGDHAVVGAGAVVNRDVEAYSIVAGVPARRVGTVKLNGPDVTFVYE